jgi:hypothetical protein
MTMKKNLIQASFAGSALLALLSGLPVASALEAELAAPSMPPSFEAFDCSALSEGLCDAIALALADFDATLPGADSFQAVGLYQDVYPNGQFGNFDCIYDSATNKSIFVERWGVHVEAGTLNGSTRNPIVNTNVYYPFVDSANGNAC